MTVTIVNPEIEGLLELAMDYRNTANEAGEPFIDVIATLPNSDFRHLAEKIRMPKAWWEAKRIEGKKFRKEFNTDLSFFFIVCDGFIQGFWYLEGFWYDRYNPRILHFPDEWLCIEPIEMRGFQGIRNANFSCVAKSRKESFKIIDEEWKPEKRFNPETGRWEIRRGMWVPRKLPQGY